MYYPGHKMNVGRKFNRRSKVPLPSDEEIIEKLALIRAARSKFYKGAFYKIKSKV